MKSELEQKDVEAIAQKLEERLKPLFANSKKDNDVIFTKKSLAQYLEVSIKWVDGYKSIGMPYIPIKGHVRFRKSDIDKWLESMKVPAVNRIDRLLKGMKREQP